jgi:hypothetical protein
MPNQWICAFFAGIHGFTWGDCVLEPAITVLPTELAILLMGNFLTVVTKTPLKRAFFVSGGKGDRWYLN